MASFVPSNQRHRTFVDSGNCPNNIQCKDDNTSLNKPEVIYDNIIIQTPPRDKRGVTSQKDSKRPNESVYISINNIIPPTKDPKGIKSEDDSKRIGESHDYIDIIN